MITKKDKNFYLAVFKLLDNSIKCRCGGPTEIIDILDLKDNHLLIKVKHTLIGGNPIDGVTAIQIWIYSINEAKFINDGQSTKNDTTADFIKFGWDRKKYE